MQHILHYGARLAEEKKERKKERKMNNSYCDHFSFATLKLLLCSAITTAEWARFYKLLYSTFRC